MYLLEPVFSSTCNETSVKLVFDDVDTSLMLLDKVDDTASRCCVIVVETLEMLLELSSILWQLSSIFRVFMATLDERMEIVSAFCSTPDIN